MLKIIRSKERYHFETDWLSAYWHFSFDRYHDPQNVSFGPLRVFNNDTIQAGKGFPMHPHRDMEILTYVIDGSLEHKDSTGGRGSIRAGEAQRMSAGSGIVHSEFNASSTETVELLQVWLLPIERGGRPSYEQKSFRVEERTGRLLCIASGEPTPGAVRIGQHASFYVSRLEAGGEAVHPLAKGRRAYVFVIDGAPRLNGEALSKGDSVKATDEAELNFSSEGISEIFLIDLP